MEPSPSFADVLVAARAGESWAFTCLYEDLRRPVVTYVRLRGVRDPDDVTSEVFLSVFRGLGAFSGDVDGFRAWVFTIARRRVLDEHRRRARRVAEVGLEDATADRCLGGDVEEEALRVVGDTRVAAMLADLTPEQREVVVLRVVADLSLAQVARVTGRSVNAVKAVQHRAMTALRKAHAGEPVTPRAEAAIQWVR